MILSAQKNIDTAKASLHKAKTLLEMDNEARPMSKGRGINIELKTLENYFLVTLSPVRSAKMENKLNRIFRSRFPESFVVAQWDDYGKEDTTAAHETEISKSPSNNKVSTQTVKRKTVSNHDLKNLFGRGADGEWLALIVLAFLGLLLVIRSASQISKIKQLQKTLEETQKTNSHNLNVMGKKYE